MSKEIAKRITECFEGVSWTKQVFKFGGITADADGETNFYKASEIDLAIGKINKLIDDLKEQDA